jgi:CheY-like chemotaxis protein
MVPVISEKKQNNMDSKSHVILSVDDNEVDGALLHRAVKRSAIPATILTVTEGLQALSYLAGEGIYRDRERYRFPDLVLLDLRMPKMSGLDVLGWIRQQPTLKNTKVVILSASDNPEDKKRAHMIGADDYLLKPTKFEELQSMMKSIYATWLDKNKKPKVKDASSARGMAPVENPRILMDDPVPEHASPDIPVVSN